MEQELLQHFLDASRHMAEVRDMATLLDYVMDQAIQLVGAERGHLVLARVNGAADDMLDFRVQRGQDSEASEGGEDQVSRSIVHQVIQVGQPLVLRDATKDPQFGEADGVAIVGLRSIMCAPLIAQGDTIGAIYVENRSIRGPFHQDDILPLVLLANQAAIAIENARLFQSLQQSHDELEARVEERTLELSNANRLLKREVAERKQTEEALTRERDNAETYLNISGVIIVALDEEGTVSLVNRKGCEILEYPKAEIIGKNWFDTFLPDRLRKEVKSVFAALMAGEPQGNRFVEGMVLTGSGQERTIRWYNSVITDEEGNRTGTLSSGEDITEKKIAEEALRDSEERFRTLSEAAFEAIFLSERGICLGQNQTAERMFGYTLPEAIGKPGTEWIAPEHQELVRNNILSGSEEPYRALALRKDGTTFPVEMRGKNMRYQRREVRVTSLRDITARVRAEEAIQRGNRELAELNAIIGTITSTLALDEVLQRIVAAVLQFFPNADDATIQLLDEAGTLSTWAASDKQSAHGERITFRLGEGIAGWALQERHPVNVPDVRAESRYCPSPVPKTYRSLLVVPLLSRDEPLGTLSITSAQVGAFSEQDELSLLGLGRYAAIAVQNARLYEQTRRDAETKTVLLREVNHRVKNSLTSIIGLIHTERRYASEEGRAVVHEAMERLVQRINGLAQVHDILSQSEWSPVLLSDLASQIMSTVLDTMPLERHVGIKITPAPVRVAPRQANNLALVLNELVTNTAKYAVSSRATIGISLHIGLEGEDTILLEYRDDGPGYPEDVLRLERHGVGLYLIQILVSHALRGSLALANEGGAMTTIRFVPEKGSTA